MLCVMICWEGQSSHIDYSRNRHYDNHTSFCLSFWTLDPAGFYIGNKQMENEAENHLAVVFKEVRICL